MLRTFQHHHSVARRSAQSLLPRRHMAASSPLLFEYLVHIPDLPNTLAKRVVARPGHIEAAMPMIDAGRLPFFGITLAEHRDESKPMAMTGSVMLMKAESKEAVKRILNDDVYTKGGVWDVAKATIWPFHSG